jgi:hypothetical protein
MFSTKVEHALPAAVKVSGHEYTQDELMSSPLSLLAPRLWACVVQVQELGRTTLWLRL